MRMMQLLTILTRVVNEIKMWELQDLDPLPTWCRGRAILIGDAARRCTPNGLLGSPAWNSLGTAMLT